MIIFQSQKYLDYFRRKDETAMTETFFIEKAGTGIEITRGKKYRRISLKINHRGKLVATAPLSCPYGSVIRFAESKTGWIRSAMERARLRKEETEKLARTIPCCEAEALRKMAREILPPRVKQINDSFLKAKYNRICIKDNKSNWGSCSSKGNINLNMHLVQLPAELADYVIKHELCHLEYMNHGRNFHNLLDRLCNGQEKELSARLRKYSFLLENHDNNQSVKD